ncbi:pyridoxal phosphate-dependent transferase [Fimicolochytrium jonesii]|uniref:pyridoxal phosphate-dependent transferase n=1 Tax=Fimicolochytrium jonesii TaxID=1396493 RepID=UPI0022FE6DAB|nr:pyridoxal phosphate-dependent transferase [Fimicolochytrium jonesii]KAI8816853.1 pyridoxal phosphate-dependent transferase [Fimicolochytrium jonesii]
MTKPHHFSLEAAVRPNILALKPYRCARDDYSTGILLDANENSFGTCLPPTLAPSLLPSTPSLLPATSDTPTDTHLERYPSPHQPTLKHLISSFRALNPTTGPESLFLGVGSDESLDLIVRVFCRPGVEKVLVCPPTYGMYGVVAMVNDVGVVEVGLETGDDGRRFQLRVDEIKHHLRTDPTIKILFLCSPGNPTGTLLHHADIKSLLDYEHYKGVVVVDEAYIDFCEPGASVATWTEEYPNLVVTQTLSKSFGLAGIRLGISIASPAITKIFNATKAPYNISTPTSLLARAALSPAGVAQMREHVASITSQRSALIAALATLPDLAPPRGGTDANFILIPVLRDGKPCNTRAHAVYKRMAEHAARQVVVRFRGMEKGCEGCLRITVGTGEENKALVGLLGAVLGETA